MRAHCDEEDISHIATLLHLYQLRNETFLFFPLVHQYSNKSQDVNV